jgi:hypothetical protein
MNIQLTNAVVGSENPWAGNGTKLFFTDLTEIDFGVDQRHERTALACGKRLGFPPTLGFGTARII